MKTLLTVAVFFCQGLVLLAAEKTELEKFRELREKERTLLEARTKTAVRNAEIADKALTAAEDLKTRVERLERIIDEPPPPPYTRPTDQPPGYRNEQAVPHPTIRDVEGVRERIVIAHEHVGKDCKVCGAKWPLHAAGPCWDVLRRQDKPMCRGVCDNPHGHHLPGCNVFQKFEVVFERPALAPVAVRANLNIVPAVVCAEPPRIIHEPHCVKNPPVAHCPPKHYSRPPCYPRPYPNGYGNGYPNGYGYGHPGYSSSHHYYGDRPGGFYFRDGDGSTRFRFGSDGVHFRNNDFGFGLGGYPYGSRR